MYPKGAAYKSGSKSTKRRKLKATNINQAGAANFMVVPRTYGNPRAVTERKYFDTELDSSALAAVTTAWGITHRQDPATINTIFAPTQGDDFNQRSGRKVQVLKIQIQGEIRCDRQVNQTSADSASTIRILLVQDKQTNAAQMTPADLLQSGAGSVAIHMFQNPAAFGRFRVLKDKKFTLQNPSMAFDGTDIEQAGLIRTFKFVVKFKKPVVIHFNATNGGTVADVVDNSFHIVAGSLGTNLAPAISYKSRIVFLDQ